MGVSPYILAVSHRSYNTVCWLHRTLESSVVRRNWYQEAMFLNRQSSPVL